MTGKAFEEVVAEVSRLQADELRRWIRQGWVKPARVGRTWRFAEIDVARVRLICDLRHDMTLDEEALALVLDLLDQVYDLRRRLHVLAGVFEAAPEPVRRDLRERLAELTAAPTESP